MNQSFISKLVGGEKERLGADVLFKLAAAYGIDAGELIPKPVPAPEPPAEVPAKRRKKK